MTRPRHPDKEVEEALRYAETYGWRVGIGGSHAWGKIYCPHHDSTCRCGEFCISSIWSTPKNPGNHARQIKRIVDHCIHHLRKQDRPDESDLES